KERTVSENNYDSAAIAALVPALAVRDVSQTIAWFEALGFQTAFAMRMPDGSVVHAHLARGGAQVMLGPACAETVPGASGLEIYITVHGEDLDALCERARAAAITIGREPHDEFWGDRIFQVLHPDGYRFTFAKHVRDVSPEAMQAAMDEWASAQVPA